MVFGGDVVKSMGACCSAAARDRRDTTIMPAPRTQDRPRSGLSKLQNLRQQLHNRNSNQSKLAENVSTNQIEKQTLLPSRLDNQTHVDENINNNSPNSNRSSSTLSRKSDNANATSSMNRFGFGFKRPGASKTTDSNKNVDRSSKDSGKGSVESLDNRKNKVTPSSSMGSLSRPKTPTDRKLVKSASKSSSTKSSTSSLNSQGSRPQSPCLSKASAKNASKQPCFKTTGGAQQKPTAKQTEPECSNEVKTIEKEVANVSQGAREEKPAEEFIGYRSSRLPTHARGPLLSRLQAPSKSTEPYSTSLAKKYYQKSDQNGAPKAELKFGLRTTAVPNQLSLATKRMSCDSTKITPDSMTESIFNPEAPLATFDSLGSTSFISQVSVASDDLMLDFDDADDARGISSVASTPGDDKNIEKDFMTSSLKHKPRSKSIEALRKRSHGKSPLVIDTTDDSAYASGQSEKFDVTFVDMTSSAPPGTLSPVLDCSTDTASLDDPDKTLSSSSLNEVRSPVLRKQEAVAVADVAEEQEEGAGARSEGVELRMRHRPRGRAHTLQELSDLIHETSPSKDPLTRTRSLSSPLKPPRPRSMSGLEDDDQQILVDAQVYRQALQEITTLKTMLHKLKRCLHEEDLGLFELSEQRRGTRVGSFGSEGSLLDEASPLRRKPSQRSNPDTAAKSPTDNSPRERESSLGEIDLMGENYSLRQQLAVLRRDVEEKDHTIHLLQQQMTKYEVENQSRTYRTVTTQTEVNPSSVESTVPEPPRSKLVKPSSLPAPKSLQQSWLSG